VGAIHKLMLEVLTPCNGTADDRPDLSRLLFGRKRKCAVPCPASVPRPRVCTDTRSTGQWGLDHSMYLAQLPPCARDLLAPWCAAS
jgi:hypothetical protein